MTFGVRLLVCALAVAAGIYLALTFLVSPAAAASARPTANEIASFYAGQPVTVHPIRSTASYTFGQGEIWFSSFQLVDVGHMTSWGAVALKTLIHESLHHRFGDDEGSVECAAVLLVPDALRRFYGVPFFSARSRQMQRWALESRRDLPAAYRNCSRLVG